MLYEQLGKEGWLMLVLDGAIFRLRKEGGFCRGGKGDIVFGRLIGFGILLLLGGRKGKRRCPDQEGGRRTSLLMIHHAFASGAKKSKIADYSAKLPDRMTFKELVILGIILIEVIRLK